MVKSHTRLLAALGLLYCVAASAGPKDELRQPWQRDDTSYIRGWKVAGAFKCDLVRDCLDIRGGEAAARPDATQKRADGGALEWRDQRSWGDAIAFDAATGDRDGGVAYAAASIARAAAGRAQLAIGSVDGIRVWVNGKLVLSRDGHRSLMPDEDAIEIDLAAGANNLLIKSAATGAFTARVLETGTVLRRADEIGPSLIELQPELFTVRTDVNGARAAADPVQIEVVKAGGEVAFTANARRGELVVVDAKGWSDGPYEVRVSTHTPQQLLSVNYLPWFKGDSLAYARRLAADAAKADDSPSDKEDTRGFTLKMLAEMVDDRLGVKLADAKANPWPKIHSPLMEYAEILLEQQGKADARVRAGGFMRIAYRDEVDGTPQYARAYLPAGYDPAKPWPLVLQLHGFNPPNPVYVRWWSIDARHPNIDTEFAGHRQVIFIEPHGRGNTQYFGLGDNDVMRVIAEAEKLFNVDPSRVYLTGESMGGWGTWNVGTRHPDTFAAIAPVFGGVDYHSQMTDEQIAALSPADRFIQERWSSWARAEGLNNTPLYIRHGDADQAVSVEWTRWGVKLLQRWGYDVRYREFPGRIHETLDTSSSNPNSIIPWFLEHTRDPAPRHVRIRTPELRHAKSWWVDVKQVASPMEFADVDAEVTDRNVIRLDTRNVLEVALSPGAALIDPAQPVRVVWNGVARELRFENAVLRLTDPAYRPGKLVKNAVLPGTLVDFTATPFAVVIGTTSQDPEMVKALRTKADGFIAAWRNWQKFEPRVFTDTQVTAADIAKYSLVLFGGADANRVTASFGARVPLRLTKDAVIVDGHSFPAPAATVQMVYPNPRNPARYLWVIAGNSPAGLFGTEVLPNNLPEWDYVISDGHVPGFGQSATRTQTAVASGHFDYNWRYSPALVAAGDAAMRARANHIRQPQAGALPAATLDSYAGKYLLPNGRVIEVRREGSTLRAQSEGDTAELLPQGEDNFYLPPFSLWVAFQRDAAGRVNGFTGAGGGDFTAQRQE
jgi:predicted esterase